MLLLSQFVRFVPCISGHSNRAMKSRPAKDGPTFDCERVLVTNCEVVEMWRYVETVDALGITS